MSSSRRHRSRGLQLPTPWSEWEWNDTYKQYYRYRQIATTGVIANDYEYEYGQTGTPRSQESNPAANLTTISESVDAPGTTQEYSQESSYTTDPNPVGGLTETFNRTTLSSRGDIQPSVAQYAVSPYSQQRERSNSFSAVVSLERSNYVASGVQGSGYTDRRVRTVNDKTTVDELDPAYKVHRSSDFVFGKVFKVLWSEPTGSTGTEITTRYRDAKFKQKAYDSIRRFVVVDDRYHGHCLCLPILTYGGQATLKRGVHAENHAVIFTSKNPSIVKGESLTKKPVRMLPNMPRHHLDPMSRINYAKVYTVEHNVKVDFIGKISPKYEQTITTDYNNAHRPLPDRPYRGDPTEDEFGHTEGADPRYGGETGLRQAGYAGYAAQTAGLSDQYATPAVTSSYGAASTSSAWSTSAPLVTYAPQTYSTSPAYAQYSSVERAYEHTETAVETSRPFDPDYDVSD